MKSLITVSIMALVMVACGGASHGEPMLGDGGNTGESDGPELLSYSMDVAPIIENKCSQCHNNYSTYETLTRNIERVAVRVLDEMTMPPRRAPQLSEEEKFILAEWIEQGLPE